jgi:glycosyltransferase involved in cell wall biosynthesis
MIKHEDKMGPLVSVLIPLYNHEKYIITCLDSITADGYQNIEVIVIDDGSSDFSAQLVREWYQRKRGQLGHTFQLFSRENRGVSATLNELLSKSSGEYVSFLASDDHLLPGGITARLDFLRAHPEKQIVIADYQVIDSEGVTIKQSGVEELFYGRKKFLADDRTIAHELVFHWSLAGATYLAKKEVFLNYPYDERLVVEDWDFCLRLAADGLISFIDYPVLAYRVHEKSHTQDRTRNIQFTQSYLLTAEKGMRAFSGLQKVFLWGETLRYKGYLAPLTGKNKLLGSLQRKFGRLVRRSTMKLYDIMAPDMVRD